MKVYPNYGPVIGGLSGARVKVTNYDVRLIPQFVPLVDLAGALIPSEFFLICLIIVILKKVFLVHLLVRRYVRRGEKKIICRNCVTKSKLGVEGKRFLPLWHSFLGKEIVLGWNKYYSKIEYTFQLRFDFCESQGVIQSQKVIKTPGNVLNSIGDDKLEPRADQIESGHSDPLLLGLDGGVSQYDKGVKL